MRMQNIIAAMAVLTLTAVPTLASNAGIVVVNEGDSDIVSVTVTDSVGNEVDLLEHDDEIAPGEGAHLAFEPEGDCDVDVVAVFADSAIEQVNDVDACDGEQISFENN